MQQLKKKTNTTLLSENTHTQLASQGGIFLIRSSQQESHSPRHLMVPKATKAGGKSEVLL
jgi:hypothetical protein